MERPQWVEPLYGYLVCLIAVVTFLLSAANFIEAAFQRADPLRGRQNMGPFGSSLTSFEAFRATYAEGRPMRPLPPGVTVTGADPGDTLTTAELRARYEALRADRIAQASFEGTMQLVKHGLLLVLSAALFLFHWRWVRARSRRAAETAG
jgi:hypothetical protein